MRFLAAFLFLLVMANFSFAINRRMMMNGGEKSASVMEIKQNDNNSEVKKNSDVGGEHELINNHHNIPRQAFGGYDNNQDAPPGTP